MGDLVAELEAAVTDAGTLLVWAEKYRHADEAALPALQGRLLAAGDRARRLSRDGGLQPAGAGSLLAEVGAVARDLRALITRARSAPRYRRAVEAHAAGDEAALLALLPAIFVDLRPIEPDAGYWAPTWQRRGRPLPADTVVAQIVDLRAHGVPSYADDLTPGVDPELPGVLLSLTPPAGVPIALRYEGAALARACLGLGEDQLLVVRPVLHAAFHVVLAAPDEPLDEWVADPEAYRRELLAACARHGLSLSEPPGPES